MLLTNFIIIDYKDQMSKLLLKKSDNQIFHQSS